MKNHSHFIIYFSLMGFLAINTYIKLIDKELTNNNDQQFEFFQPNNPDSFGEEPEYNKNPNIIPE